MSYQCIIVTDIFPNKFWTRTVGVYRLATELRQAGYRVKVIYGYSDFTSEELLNLLSQFVGAETIWIGYSCTFVEMPPFQSTLHGVTRSQYPNSFFDVVPILKMKFPHVKFLVGGTSASVRTYDFADYYVLGYGDEEVPRLTAKLGQKQFPETVTIRNRTCIECESVMEFSSKQTIYQEEDAVLPGECLTVEFTRGCRFKCKFCSFPLNGRTGNAFWKNKEVLREELLRNYEVHNVRTYIIADDTFNESGKKLDYYLSLLEELPFKVQYSCFMRLDLLEGQRHLWGRLKDSGLRGAFFGIESLNHQAALSIGKNFNPDEVINLLTDLRLAWQDEVVTSGGFIAGLPFDTPQTVSSWLELLRDPQFPLHNHHVQGLYITHKDTPTTWTSEFQENAASYGYRMRKDTDNRWYWENDHWNFKEALKLAQSHNHYIHNEMETPFDCFTHTMIMGYGFSHEDAFKMKQSRPHSSDIIRQMVADRVIDYKKRISRI